MCWLINVGFLGRFYIEGRKDNLVSAYSIMSVHAKNETIDSKEFYNYMQRFCTIYNISYIIVDESGIVRTSIQDEGEFIHQLETNMNFQDHETTRILEQTGEYIISTTIDSGVGMDYLAMWGYLDHGYQFMLRCSLESIKNSVKTVNMFLLYVGLGATIVAAIIVDITANHILNPIRTLTEISERMSNLDFEAKYESKHKNEIDVLGERFNDMSSKLESVICELKNANNTLKQDVEVKTKVDEQRREFLANVSHELKTPLALIQGYAEGLKEGLGDTVEDRNYYCDVIVEETARMNSMVKQLLTLNQMEMGADGIEYERFDLSELIQNAVNSVNFLAKEKQMDLTIDYERPGAVFVWADEFKIDEVVRNYLTNALNHVNERKEVRVYITREEEGKVRVHVYNSGQNIPEESIERLWEKFYKVDKARTREYGGSGIGLSIVAAIMNSHQEKYGVRNRDQGVEFYFELSTK